MIEPKLARIAEWVGYLGVAPFALALALAMTATSGLLPGSADWALDYAESLALGWGAIILTFVAAVHWGLALAGVWTWSAGSMAGAIVPSMVALTALLTGGVQGLAVLVAGFGLFWLYEHRHCADRMPADYLRLRRTLTLSVCALLTLTAFTLDAGWSS